MRVQVNGYNLKEMRLKRNISQTQLATNIGCSKGSISRIELEKMTKISEHTVKSMAVVLNCSEGYLMGTTSDPTNTTSNDRDGCMDRLNGMVKPLPDDRLESVVKLIDLTYGCTDYKLNIILGIVESLVKTL